jgi:hypothetical protein
MPRRGKLSRKLLVIGAGVTGAAVLTLLGPVSVVVDDVAADVVAVVADDPPPPHATSGPRQHAPTRTRPKQRQDIKKRAIEIISSILPAAPCRQVISKRA